jgi:hypothetical protein
MKNTLAENLQRAIHDSPYDMKTVSLRAKLGETYVRDVIAGRVQEPTYGKLAKVAKVLNTTVSQLVGETVLASIPVAGYVDHSERVFLFFGNLSRMQALSEKDVVVHGLKLAKPPEGISNSGDLLMVEETSENGSILYPKNSQVFIKKSRIITADFDIYLGKRVLAECESGIYIRELDKGSEFGKYTLLSIGGRDHIRNATLSACVPIYIVVHPD